jgi:membrane-bound inhibitor of C-type lysozyme
VPKGRGSHAAQDIEGKMGSSDAVPMPRQIVSAGCAYLCGKGVKWSKGQHEKMKRGRLNFNNCSLQQVGGGGV